MTQQRAPIKVILTGATGMVGEGVLHECLSHPMIREILIINRKPAGITHLKLKEIIHPDFYNFSKIENQLQGYDACFFCLGVSSVGMKEEKYQDLTYKLTMHVAQTLSRINPGSTFCYISGAGTDSSEKGKTMWARVKGKTENDLMKLPFGKVYNFRPGILSPTKGLKNTLGFYKYLGWLIPAIKTFGPNFISSLKDLGMAMIHVAVYGYNKPILEVKDINSLAKQ
ncbi:MAG: NAD-dependent epimerase/dehydratase family protein [Bacteroidota bacterium]